MEVSGGIGEGLTIFILAGSSSLVHTLDKADGTTFLGPYEFPS